MSPPSMLIACRGTWTRSGLHRAALGAAEAATQLLVPVPDLAALVRHPLLPIVYGVSGTPPFGRLHGWRLTDDGVEELFTMSSGGEEPCHVDVDATGRLLVATNYGSGSLAVVGLAADGSAANRRHLIQLPGTGSGVVADRQRAPHPHQAVFAGDRLWVTELGSDLIRRFRVHPDRPLRSTLEEDAVVVLPPGTGPRHLAVVGQRVLAVDGELAQTVVVLDPGGTSVAAVVPSTRGDRPVRTRHHRNYPGDLTVTPDGRHLVVANRGHDTLGLIALDPVPRLVDEVDAGVRWPQHLAWTDEVLWVAGWESAAVVGHRWTGSSFASPQVGARCDAPGWLLPESAR